MIMAQRPARLTLAENCYMGSMQDMFYDECVFFVFKAS